MKILIIGCGSIGQRHIRNLCSLRAGRIFAFDIDKKRLADVRKISPSVTVSTDIKDMWDKNPEIALITVPTALHMKYALGAAKRGCHLFIEKPLSNSIAKADLLQNIIKQKKLVTLIGCNMRFHWAISRTKELLSRNMIGKIVSARLEAGQYLPDWHPREDYRKMYSASKRQGGGVILDIIHEIDYAIWFFGDIENIKSLYGKLSGLKIETEDVAEILLKFKKAPIVNIHLDYVQRYYSRSCKIIGQEGTISWDFNDNSVKVYRAETKKWKVYPGPRKYKFNQTYIDEIKYFLSCVKKRQKTFNDVSFALKTLKVALAAKK